MTPNYDANNRLTTETKVTGEISDITRYRYDPNGNQYSITREAVAADTKAEELILTQGLADSELYRYNGFNQLTSVITSEGAYSYSYYPSGIRATKSVNGSVTKFILNGANTVLEIDGGAVSGKYVRGVNLIQSTINGIENWYLYNAHGDVVQLMNASGVVTRNYDYDAFGVEKDPDPEDANPWRYCGEYFDLSSGTYYLRARYYQPTTGRFLSEDTHWNPRNMIYGDNPAKWNERSGGTQDYLGLNAYTYKPNIKAIMQAGNLYAYCINNPLMYIDYGGEALSLSTVHHWVVEDIRAKNAASVNMISNTRIDYKNGLWGFADLVSLDTGEVWEVKKNSKWISMTSATKQLGKYVAGSLHNDKLKQNTPNLYTGGSQGTYIPMCTIVKQFGPLTYYVSYWDNGNGIILYEFDTLPNWAAIVAAGSVIIGGILYIVSQGAFGPELIPQPAH